MALGAPMVEEIPEPKTLAFDLPGSVWLYSFLRRKVLGFRRLRRLKGRDTTTLVSRRLCTSSVGSAQTVRNDFHKPRAALGSARIKLINPGTEVE